MGIGVTEDHEALAEAVRGWADRAGLRASARAALEAPESRPDWFADLGRQGLLGLHLAEEAGGSGAGGVELAVAVEELGRVFAHGPSLPTVVASLVLSKAGGTAAKEQLPALADGSTTAAVALGLGSLAATSDADGVSVSGTVRPVLGGGLADLLVLGARDGEAQVWFVVDAAHVAVAPLPGMDGTRRPAELVLESVRVPESRLLPGLTLDEVRVLAGVVVAAEATGLAGWALDTATAYA
jgi:alkylation response protein AidB-like acyl-CoA dehydrogenase